MEKNPNLDITTMLVDQLAILIEYMTDQGNEGKTTEDNKQAKAKIYVEECVKYYKKITESNMSEKTQIDSLLKFYGYMKKFLTVIQIDDSLSEYYQTIDALVQKLGETIIQLKYSLIKKVSESKTEMENFSISLIDKDRSCTFESYYDYDYNETTFNDMWKKAKTSRMKTLLLYGSQGNGKKMVSKCLSFKAKCTFLDLNCPDLFDKIENFPVYLSHTIISRGPTIIYIPNIEKYNSFKDKLLFFFEKIIDCKTNHMMIIGSSVHPIEINKEITNIFAWKQYIGPVPQKYKSVYIEKLLSGRQYNITTDQFQDLVKTMIKYSNEEIVQIIKKTIRKIEEKDMKIVKYENIVQAMTYFPGSITVESLMEYKIFQ